MINLVYQPAYSNTCGHAVVAMLTGNTIERIAAILGHERPTSWRDLSSVLFTLGVVCEPVLLPCFCVGDMPPVGVVCVPTVGTFKHWVLKYGENIYDPAGGVYGVDALSFSYVPATTVLRCAAVRGITVC